MYCTGKLCSRAAQRMATSLSIQQACQKCSNPKDLSKTCVGVKNVSIIPRLTQTSRFLLTTSSSGTSTNRCLSALSLESTQHSPSSTRCSGMLRSGHDTLTRSHKMPLFWPTYSQLLPHRTFSKYVVIKDGQVVSSVKIKNFCSENGMVFREGHACIITTCPRFTTQRLKLDEVDQLYINKTTGFFVCHSCKQSGTWDKLEDNITLMRDVRDKKRKMHRCFEGIETDGSENNTAKEFWMTTVALDTLELERLEYLKRIFEIEGLTIDTLKKFQVHTVPNEDALVFPIINVNGEVNAVRIMTYIEPDHKKKSRKKILSRTIPRVDFQGLFGWSASKRGDDIAILTSNELDAMAVSQETGSTAVALPKGISTLPQKVLPLLERYSSIILWLGEDVHSWVAAKQFARKLGEKRCSLIRPDSQNRAPLPALKQGVKLGAILGMSKPIVHDSIACFKDLRHDVYTELSEAEAMAGTQWQRFPQLNELLKGHRRGELTVFTGPTGSGKTTFMSEYSLDLCQQGVNTLWGSFEINNVRLLRTMLTQFAGINLMKNLDAFDQNADMFEMLPMYFMTFHGEENIKKVIDTMSHAVYIHDISHVIVDNLQFMMGASNLQSIDRYTKQDSLIAAFRKFATQMNCHVTLVIHPRKERDTDELSVSSIFGSAKATQEADNVLILQDRRLTSIRARKYLQIVKNRYDGDLGVMVLRFNKEALSFALKPKDKPEANPKKSKSEVIQEHIKIESLKKGS